MDLKNLQEHWKNFPEMSMEERPVLSSDLEKMVVNNPLNGAFYLKNKLLGRILLCSALWLLDGWQLRSSWRTGGNDLYQEAFLFVVLAYSIYYHTRILLYADYSSLLSLRLLAFLGKLETLLDKYIVSFRIISILAGCYLLIGIRKLLSLLHGGASTSLDENSWYKWLILIFLSVSFYILLMNSVIPKYKKLLTTVRIYKGRMLAKAQKG